MVLGLSAEPVERTEPEPLAESRLRCEPAVLA
jgi:hypothetical protein